MPVTLLPHFNTPHLIPKRCLNTVSLQWELLSSQGKKAIYGEDPKPSNGYNNYTNGVASLSPSGSKKYQ